MLLPRGTPRSHRKLAARNQTILGGLLAALRHISNSRSPGWAFGASTACSFCASLLCPPTYSHHHNHLHVLHDFVHCCCRTYPRPSLQSTFTFRSARSVGRLELRAALQLSPTRYRPHLYVSIQEIGNRGVTSRISSAMRALIVTGCLRPGTNTTNAFVISDGVNSVHYLTIL